MECSKRMCMYVSASPHSSQRIVNHTVHVYLWDINQRLLLMARHQVGPTKHNIGRPTHIASVFLHYFWTYYYVGIGYIVLPFLVMHNDPFSTHISNFFWEKVHTLPMRNGLSDNNSIWLKGNVMRTQYIICKSWI